MHNDNHSYAHRIIKVFAIISEFLLTQYDVKMLQIGAYGAAMGLIKYGEVVHRNVRVRLGQIASIFFCYYPHIAVS